MRTTLLMIMLAVIAPAQTSNWVNLFDGKTLNGWSKAGADAWDIQDGAIHSIPKPRLREDLVSDKKFKNFELTWEWRVAPKANSGLKYLVQDSVLIDEAQLPTKMPKFEDQVAYAFQHRNAKPELVKKGSGAQTYPVAFEYQMIDDAGHADAMAHPESTAGALYSVFPPAKHMGKPAGEWNQSRIVLRGLHVEHWLNGEKVIDAQLDDPQVKAKLERRWPPGHPVHDMLTKLPKRECPITLQHHNDEAWFRNIKIRPLP